MHWCIWAGQEVCPPWLAQAGGCHSCGTVRFPWLCQDCVQPWHLFSLHTEAEVEQGCECYPVVFLLAGWSGSLPVDSRSHGQLKGEKDETGCLHSTLLAPRFSEPTTVQPAREILKLASALCSTG